MLHFFYHRRDQEKLLKAIIIRQTGTISLWFGSNCDVSEHWLYISVIAHMILRN